jgi:two-component system response regulator YesN
VAREMYMSRTQFVRRMRKETGKTFIEFLNSYRISEAQTLLKQSEWTTHTIAQFLGFKSPTYFYALFRTQVGCTPGEYRSQHRIGKTV